MTKRKLRKELSELARKSEVVATLYSGSLGIYIGGTQYVDVPNRPGFVYVRLRNNISELIQAHNEVVSPVYGLPVLLIRNKTYYEIYGRDTVQYASYWDSNSSYLPKHGHQHEFDPDNNGGGDLVFVHGEQFYPMMTFPSGSDGGNTVLIAPYRYFYRSQWYYTGNTGVGDLLQYGPTGANNAKLLLVGTTSATGNPFVKLGSEFSEGITGAAALTSFVPTNITPIDEIPGAIIRLVTGTQTITWANIYDARQYMGILQAGSGTGSGATTFLALTDTPSSYAGQASKFVSVRGDESGLEFVTSSPGGGGNGVVIYDDGAFKVTGSAISFDNNLSVVVTGSIAYISASGGGSTGTVGRVLIQTNTPNNTTGTSFQGIPATYGNLEIVYAARVKTSFSTLSIYFNADYTSTNYLFQRLSTSSTSVAGLSSDGSPVGVIASTYPYSPGFGKIYIPNYAGTYFNKQANVSSGWRDDETTITERAYFIDWENHSAINRIDLVLDAGNFTTGTVFYLYGEEGTVGGGGAGATSFLGLTDTPNDYSGQADKLVVVNSAANALEFRTNTGSFGGGGGTTLGLGFYGQDEAVGLGTGTTLNVVGSDISLSISGTVLTLLHSDPTGTPHSFLDLTDTPDTYSGQGSKYVAVNSGATALEFVTAPAGGGGSSGLVVYDDSVYKVTGTAISFDSNLSVVVTGSVAYVSASGGSGALVLLEQHSITTGSASLNFTSCISSTYDRYEIEFINISPVTTNQNFFMRALITGTYDANSNYQYIGWYDGNGDSFTAIGNASDTSMKIAQSVSTQANYSLNGWMKLINPAGGSKYPSTLSEVVSPVGAGNAYGWHLHGFYKNLTVMSGFQFLFASGNIAAGTIRVYGVTK